MRDDDKTDLPGWLGLRRDPDFDKARWLGSALSVVAVVLFVMAVAVVMAVLGHALFDFGIDAPRIGFGTGAVAVALIGAPFVIWRSVVAQKTVNVTEQGHITDRINTAVQGLGAEKTVKRDAEEYTQPNLEVRIGAIYALERIAQDSDRDHVQIMEILCAYIRQNAQGEDVTVPEGAAAPTDWAKWAQKNFRQLRLDIYVVLTILSRRSESQKQQEFIKGYQIDLQRLRMQKLELGHYDMTRANMRSAKMEGATVGSVKLKHADFFQAKLQGIFFINTELQGASFKLAKLDGAKFHQVRMDADTNLKNASLKGTSLYETDLSNVSHIEDHLTNMFGDASVTLPGGHGPEHDDWPVHWPKFKLDHDNFYEQWRKWLDDPDNYNPPDAPHQD